MAKKPINMTMLCLGAFIARVYFTGEAFLAIRPGSMNAALLVECLRP